MPEDRTTDQIIKDFEERMKKRHEEEEKLAKKLTEQLRADYLRRTGRTQ